MFALFLSFPQVGDEDAGEAFLTENEEKEKEVEGEKEEVQINDVRKGAVWAIVREFIKDQTGEQPRFMQNFSLSELLAWGEDKFPEVFKQNLTKHVILNSPNIFGLAEGDDDTIYIESLREAEQALASMVNYQAEERKVEEEEEVEGEEEVEDEEEIDKEEAEEGIASARPIVDDVEKGTRRNQPGTDDHRPLSSAGEEIFTECMDCFRQWTHECTEDREAGKAGGGAPRTGRGRLDRRGGGDGRQTERGVGGRSGVQGEPGAAAGRGGRQTDRGGGQAGRGGRRASGGGRGLNAGRDGDRQGGPGEPTVRRIPSTSAEEADTQSTM